MRVFVAGPRAVSALNKNITDILSRIIDKRMTVLLGDANGVDRLAQEYFADAKYLDVYVYACNGKVRNNVGHWAVINVEVPSGIKGFDYYSKKDTRMAQDADNGFMVWNGKSKGTLSNIINLASQNKKSIVYFVPNRKTLCIDNLSDVDKLAKSMEPEIYTLYRELCQKNVFVNKSESYEQLSLSELFIY